MVLQLNNVSKCQHTLLEILAVKECMLLEDGSSLQQEH